MSKESDLLEELNLLSRSIRMEREQAIRSYKGKLASRLNFCVMQLSDIDKVPDNMEVCKCLKNLLKQTYKIIEST